MAQLTIEVPEDMVSRLESVQSHLVDILELGLREFAAENYPLHDEIVEFLARGPSPAEIVRFHPSEQIAERLAILLEKNRSGSLTRDEQAELDQYEMLDYLMIKVKARARRHLGNEL